jgi:hypothetical protein
MALDFDSAGSTRRVDHGSGASIDDLAPAGLTACGWVYRTSDGDNQHIFTKDGPISPSGWAVINVLVGGSQGGLRFHALRATTNNVTISAAGVIPLNAWTFVAATYDDTLTPECDLYTGSLTALATEVSYSSTTDGSGTHTSDASANLYIGNIQRANTNPFRGRIANFQLYNSRLTLEQVQALQFRQWIRDSGCKLWTELHDSTATQPDLSGNSNNGTVTGATNADHVPLGLSWTQHPMPYVVAAAPVTGWNPLLSHTRNRLLAGIA